jgi:hypothetical protein
LQFFRMIAGQTQSRGEDAGLVAAARVLGTQAIFAQPDDVHNGAVCARQLHGVAPSDVRVASWSGCGFRIRPSATSAEAGIPERTRKRAKEELPVRSHKDYDWVKKRGEWWWYDPAAPWPKKAPFARPSEEPPMPWEV